MLEEHYLSGEMKGSCDYVRLNIGIEGDKGNIGDLPPANNPILVNIIKCHTDDLQPVDDNVNREEGYKRSRYRNPYTPFMDKDEFEFAFRLVIHEISKMAIDDTMALHTINSNVPKQHLNLRVL